MQRHLEAVTATILNTNVAWQASENAFQALLRRFKKREDVFAISLA